MHVCVWMWVWVWVWERCVWVRVSMSVSVKMCVWMSVWVWEHVWMGVYEYVCVSTNECVYECECLCVWTSMPVWVYVSMWVWECVWMSMYECVWVWENVCEWVCMCVRVCEWVWVYCSVVRMRACVCNWFFSSTMSDLGLNSGKHLYPWRHLANPILIIFFTCKETLCEETFWMYLLLSDLKRKWGHRDEEVRAAVQQRGVWGIGVRALMTFLFLKLS